VVVLDDRFADRLWWSLYGWLSLMIVLLFVCGGRFMGGCLDDRFDSLKKRIVLCLRSAIEMMCASAVAAALTPTRTLLLTL
jgi:hypothetical protein